MRAPTVIAMLDKLRGRKHNYRSAFGHGAPAEKALIHLGKYCHAFDNEIVLGDHDRTLILAGMRRAYFLIIDYLQFEPDELMRLYGAAKRQSGDE